METGQIPRSIITGIHWMSFTMPRSLCNETHMDWQRPMESTIKSKLSTAFLKSGHCKLYRLIDVDQT